MSQVRSASFAAALAVAVLPFVDFVSVSGQGAATFRGRTIETFAGRRAVAGEVLVRFRPRATAPSLAELDLAESEPLTANVRRLRARGGGLVSLMSRLAARADVEFVEPNYLIEPVALPSDPFFPLETGLFNMARPGSDVHATAAWDTATGSRVGVVALLDTGADYTHPDLVDNIWSAPAPFTVSIAGQSITCPAGTHGFDAVRLTCDPMDDQGHGTSMAGIIGATGNNGIGISGVNWSTSVMPIKFIDASGQGSYADAIRGIEFAIQTSETFGDTGGRVRVLSASWRGTGSSQALADAVERARAHDMLLVAAAGNDGMDVEISPVFPASLPHANVLSAAAASVDDAREGYSNFGAVSIDLAAPGATYTTALGGGYRSVSGTSAAAAFVSGAAELILSRCALSTPQLKALMLQSVDAVEALRFFVLTSGRLNVDRALSTCRGANDRPSVSILTPAMQQVFVEGDSVGIEADAYDADGSIARVDFYRGSTWLGQDRAAPYGMSAGAWPVGSYRITAVATDNEGATATSVVVPITVRSAVFGAPSPWQQRDLGATGVAGHVLASASSLTVTGAGTDIWGPADAFTYVYQPLTGDGEIVARVASVQYVDQWTKAGVMLRESLTAESSHAFTLLSAGKGAAFQRRITAGGTTTHTAGGGLGAPAWVRLTRSGQTVTASLSVDGANWTVIGSEAMNWPQTIYAGLAVTSHVAGEPASVAFDNIALSAHAASQPPPASLPSGWSTLDVGPVGIAGSSHAQNGVFSVTAAGADIWGSNDAFHFAYTPMTGDGEIVARVASIDGGASWAKAGVMVRSSLDAYAAHGFALVSAARGAAFQRRSAAGGLTTHTDAGALTAPVWVRLVRSGDVLSAFTSFDGQNWTHVGSDRIALGVTAFVGLAVSSHDAGQVATATFDHVTVVAGLPVAPAPPALPSGWSSADVGHVGVIGVAQQADGTFTVAGAGADVWGTADAFQFVYATLPGDGSVTARVASVDFVHAWTKAGVMLRQSLDAASAHAMMLVSAGKGAAFQRRPAFGVPSTHTAGPAVAAPLWLRLTRNGTSVAAFTSSDGISWTLVGTDVIAMEGTVYAGLVVSSHDASISATAVFTDVSLHSF